MAFPEVKAAEGTDLSCTVRLGMSRRGHYLYYTLALQYYYVTTETEPLPELLNLGILHANRHSERTWNRAWHSR